jgi:hypothetical protein
MKESIVWQAFLPEGPFDPITFTAQTAVTTIPAIETFAQDIAREICETFFTQDFDCWEEWYGDDDDASILLIITSPPAVAGAYEVDLRRVFKATARPIEDPRAAG